MEKQQVIIHKAKLVTPKGKNKDGWHLEVHWTIPTPKGPGKNSKEWPINPHPDLVSAFQKLSPYIAELTDQYNAEGELDSMSIETRGYTLNGEGDKEGITVTGQRKVSGNRSITLNTPFLKWDNGDDVLEDIQGFSKAVDLCNTEVLAYLFDNKYATSQPGEIFHEKNIETELDSQRPTRHSTVPGTLQWAKVKDNTVFLPPGEYEEGLKDLLIPKLEKAGGKEREDNFLIWDFEQDPTEVVMKLSNKKNKYLQAVEA